jgi:hypothetical protein
LCRKKMAFWSAGPKCGNYFHAAESGRRCDQMTLSIPDICPCAIQSRPFGLPYGYFFTTQGHESRRRLSENSKQHLKQQSSSSFFRNGKQQTGTFPISKSWKNCPKEHHVCLRYHTEVILAKDRQIDHLTTGSIWVH